MPETVDTRLSSRPISVPSSLNTATLSIEPTGSYVKNIELFAGYLSLSLKDELTENSIRSTSQDFVLLFPFKSVTTNCTVEIPAGTYFVISNSLTPSFTVPYATTVPFTFQVASAF
jgi:hypothetical protein